MSDRAPVDVALVVPVYNERDSLPLLIDEITRAVGGGGAGRSYEIVAVDDGSTDGSLEVLRGLRRGHPGLRGVALGGHARATAAPPPGVPGPPRPGVVAPRADPQDDPAHRPPPPSQPQRRPAAAGV